jgi:hypothetical protein
VRLATLERKVKLETLEQLARQDRKERQLNLREA